MRDEDLKTQIVLKLDRFGSPMNFLMFSRITSINFRFYYFCRLVSATFLTDVGWTEKIPQCKFSRLLQVLTHFQDEEVNKNVETSEEKRFKGITGRNAKVSMCKLHFLICIFVFVTLCNVIITLQGHFQ